MKTGVWPDAVGVRPVIDWPAEPRDDGTEPPGDGGAELWSDSRPGAVAAGGRVTAVEARGRTGAGAPVEVIPPAEARARARARARVRASARAVATARAEIGARAQEVARAEARVWAPVTGAVIGDQLRVPIARCEMGSCLSWYGDPAALGEADIRARAVRAGWRVDALGRLACPPCQQTALSFEATRPAAPWNRPAAITRAAPAPAMRGSTPPAAPPGQAAAIPAPWPVAIPPAARPGQDSTARTRPLIPCPPAGRHAKRQPALSVPAQGADRGPSAAGSTGWRWLRLAAEMAGLAGSDGWASPDPATGPGRLPRIATRTPHQDARSVRAAREFTLATLRRWGASERSEDIATVVSELLTNALRHALPALGDTQPRRSIRLGLLRSGPHVLCAVADPRTATPVPLTPGPLAESGHGLHIIRALSDRWGYTTVDDTAKVVWAAFTHN